LEDITSIFLKHIEGQLSAIPWSEEGLNEETNTIKQELTLLNKKGWWTVASQPAVNGIKSTGRILFHLYISFLLTFLQILYLAGAPKTDSFFRKPSWNCSSLPAH